MSTEFKNRNVNHEKQGGYYLTCIVTKEQSELHIGVWATRHRRYLKQYHRIRYYNLLTSEKLYPYLSDTEEEAQNLFSRLVKDFDEKENVTGKLKSDSPILWVQKMNNIRNRATEIVNEQV